jgi:FkbM family methyltransferase
MNIAGFCRVWLRHVAALPSDARLAADPSSFLRLARVRIVPAGSRAVAVSLAVDGTNFDVFVRPRSSDAIVVTETFIGQYHLPPVAGANVRRILDLGANIGLTTAHFAVLFPEAKVVGVELDAENAELARRNISRWADRCSVVHRGVWVRDEPVRYRLARGAECGATLADDGRLAVDGIALGTLLAQIGWEAVDFVKMDIEGAEQLVLRENTAWASRVHSIKVETHGDYRREKCADDLARLGFSVAVDPRHPAAVSGVRRASPPSGAG